MKLRVSLNRRALHRLATVRRVQGISRPTLARHMNVDVAEIRRQEAETSDLPLSVLYEWRKILDVPISELLVDSDGSLSQPLQQRAQLIRLMKTALSLLEQANTAPERLMAQNIVDQLTEIMPELEGVSAWNVVGIRRTLDEVGAAALRMVPEDLLHQRRAS